MTYQFGSKVTRDRRRHAAIRTAERIEGRGRHELYCTQAEYKQLLTLAAQAGIRPTRMGLEEAILVLSDSGSVEAKARLGDLDPGVVAAALAARTAPGDRSRVRPVAAAATNPAALRERPDPTTCDHTAAPEHAAGLTSTTPTDYAEQQTFDF